MSDPIFERAEKQRALQTLVDAIGAHHQAKRAQRQVTLGDLVERFRKFNEDHPVDGWGKGHSYRGFYEDAAFDPTNVKINTVGDLLDEIHRLVRTPQTGYKGGKFQMDEATPIWISEWGHSSREGVVDLDTDGPITPVTETFDPMEDD